MGPPQILNAIKNWTSHSTPSNPQGWFVVFLGFAMVFGNTGFWPMPNLIDQFIVSQNLTAIPFPDPNTHYIYTNYLQPVIFSLLGGNSFVSYAIYTSSITVIFFFIFSFWFIGHHGENSAIGQYKLLAALIFPIFAMPFYWIGMDGMTLLLMLLAMIAFPFRWAVIPAVFLGIQHFEQGFAAFLLLTGTIILHFITKRNSVSVEPLKTSILIVVGVVIGKAILTVWFKGNGIELSGARNSFMENNLPLFLSMWSHWWPYIGWSLFGVGWFLLVARVKFLWPFFVGAIFTFFFTSVVGDQTRVGTIILFPSLFYWVFMNKSIWQGISKHFVMTLLVMYMVLPIVVVWGQPFGNLWSYDIKVAQQFSNNELTVDSFDWLYPFRGERVDSLPMISDRLFFRADRLPSRVGQIKAMSRVAANNPEEVGFLSFGPYIDLRPGRYIATFKYTSSLDSGMPIGWADVTTAQGQDVIIRVTLNGTQGISSYTDIPFVLDQQARGLEVRFWYDGVGGVSLNSLEIRLNSEK